MCKTYQRQDYGVRTTLLAWSSAKHFSSKLMKLGEDMMDMESEEYWAKQWLYLRNQAENICSC
jgi:hypothetical protein